MKKIIALSAVLTLLTNCKKDSPRPSYVPPSTRITQQYHEKKLYAFSIELAKVATDTANNFIESLSIRTTPTNVSIETSRFLLDSIINPDHAYLLSIYSYILPNDVEVWGNSAGVLNAGISTAGVMMSINASNPVDYWKFYSYDNSDVKIEFTYGGNRDHIDTKTAVELLIYYLQKKSTYPFRIF
jgi:hypothetical protein